MTQGNIAILLENMLQTMGFFLSDSLDPIEVNLHLDKGVTDLIEEVLTGLRNNGSFESNEVRLDELRLLKETGTEVTPTTTTTSEVKFTLPTNYYDYIRFKLKVTHSSLTIPKYSKARIVRGDLVDDLLDDTYFATTYKSPMSTVEGNILTVFVDDFAVTGMTPTYIKKPEKFDIENKKDVEYPLSEKAINRILDKVAIELSKVLENYQKAQSLTSNKLI